MVEEFLEKLPEIDTRYEVSTKRLALFSCSSPIEKSGKHGKPGWGTAIVSRQQQQQQQQPPARHPVVLLLACLLFVLLFKLHFPTSICIMLTLPNESRQAKPSQARRSVYIGRIFNQFANAACCSPPPVFLCCLSLPSSSAAFTVMIAVCRLFLGFCLASTAAADRA